MTINGKLKSIKEQKHYVDKIFYGISFIVILIIISIIFTLHTTNNLAYKIEVGFDQTNRKINQLDSNINLINYSLQLESEDHFLDVINKVERSTVRVIACPADDKSQDVVLYLDTNLGSCALSTGFSFNDKGYIITSYHGVATHMPVVGIIFDNGTIGQVTNGIFNENLDLAILEIETDVPKLEIDDGIAKIGSSVGFVGFPLGETTKIATKGTISGIITHSYRDNLIPVYTISAFLNKGNSGGAVFSLKTGKVIGIINQIKGGVQGIGISTPINQEIINLLQRT